MPAPTGRAGDELLPHLSAPALSASFPLPPEPSTPSGHIRGHPTGMQYGQQQGGRRRNLCAGRLVVPSCILGWVWGCPSPQWSTQRQISLLAPAWLHLLLLLCQASPPSWLKWLLAGVPAGTGRTRPANRCLRVPMETAAGCCRAEQGSSQPLVLSPAPATRALEQEAGGGG